MPRFRVDDSDWAEGDFADVEQLKDDSMSVGALSEAEVVVDDDAEFEEEVAARRRGFRANRPPKAPSGATVAPPADRPPREERPARSRRKPQLERGDEMPAPRASDSGAGGAGPDLQTRVLTGVAIAVVALVMFKLGRGPAAFLVAIVVGLAAFELYEAFRRQGYHPATILGVLGAMAMVGIAYKADNYGLQAFPLVTALIVIFTMLWYMAEVVKARPVINIAITLFVFSYVGVLGAFGGLLLSSPNGTGLVLGTAICAVGYDVFGYFIGSQFGRSRLAPRLSPNKTWEGLFGGMLASLILGAVVSAFLTPWDGSITDGLALGLVVAIVAPLGDLCESMIKRDLGVKDLGTILPGHGGILDRFDAILFCLPAVFYLAIQLGIG
jgi:phosphatidate cytidylyltransferase